MSCRVSQILPEAVCAPRRWAALGGGESRYISDSRPDPAAAAAVAAHAQVSSPRRPRPTALTRPACPQPVPARPCPSLVQESLARRSLWSDWPLSLRTESCGPLPAPATAQRFPTPPGDGP